VRLLAATGAMVLLASACGNPPKPAPIAGYWSFKGGAIQVRGSGSGFEGVIVRKPDSGDCAEPPGYVLLKLNGSGSHYTGQEEWWEDPGCERRYANGATVDVTGDSARLCSPDPFPGPPPSECVDMKRLQSLPPA
jgi:hypothetical protein